MAMDAESVGQEGDLVSVVFMALADCASEAHRVGLAVSRGAMYGRRSGRVAEGAGAIDDPRV